MQNVTVFLLFPLFMVCDRLCPVTVAFLTARRFGLKRFFFSDLAAFMLTRLVSTWRQGDDKNMLHHFNLLNRVVSIRIHGEVFICVSTIQTQILYERSGRHFHIYS